tara:strand:- start:89 stop:421 length:333 start_codon:yes stop_codon:yes gene_type:complete
MKKQLYTIYFSIDTKLNISDVLNRIIDALSNGLYYSDREVEGLKRMNYTGHTLLKATGGWVNGDTDIESYVLQTITDSNEDEYFHLLKESIQEIANQQEVLITNTIINTI